MLNFAAIVQIRRGATRLPDKPFQRIGKRPLIEHVVSRLKTAKNLDDVIVATTTDPLDDKIEGWCNERSVPYFRGSEQDVLLRYVEAARQFAVKNIVRVCGDNPFIDIDLIDLLVAGHQEADYDLTNTKNNGVLGSGSEVITTSSLEIVERIAQKTAYREHVTPYFYDHHEGFRLHSVDAFPYLSDKTFRITIDTEQDLELCRNVYNSLSEATGNSKDCIISTKDVVEFLEKNPEIAAMNQNVQQKNWKEELEAEA